MYGWNLAEIHENILLQTTSYNKYELFISLPCSGWLQYRSTRGLLLSVLSCLCLLRLKARQFLWEFIYYTQGNLAHYSQGTSLEFQRASRQKRSRIHLTEVYMIIHLHTKAQDPHSASVRAPASLAWHQLGTNLQKCRFASSRFCPRTHLIVLLLRKTHSSHNIFKCCGLEML